MIENISQTILSQFRLKFAMRHAKCHESRLIWGTKVVRNHALQSAKASKELTEKLCLFFTQHLIIS
jgi:hypothetical protein